jgi:hypothetical protein
MAATPRPALIAALLLGLLAGVGYALVEFALECRAPSSEECFWARHYFPLSLGLSIGIVGGVVGGAVCAGLLLHRRRRSKHDAS